MEPALMAGPQQLSILVVDPDEDHGASLADFLEGEGYRAATAREGSGALDEVKRGRCQIVLLSLETDADGGGGAALLQQIRSVDSDLCVITMTERPTVESAVATMKCNAFDYLRKPFDLEELRRVLREAIRTYGLLVDLEQRLNGEIGRRVRERRTDRALTLKQLANRTGLSVSLISQIELGKSAASLSTLHKLATALGVKMTYFFETL